MIAQNRFIENGDQWPKDVLFATDIPAGKLYVQNTSFLFDIYDKHLVDDVFASHSGSSNPIPPPKRLDCHAYKINFLGANLVIPEGKEKYSTKYNFFKGDNPKNWGRGLDAFSTILFEDIYSDIDLKIYSATNLKYDFILKPFADADEIQLKYDGVKAKLNEKGQIELHTSVGTIIESKPFAYQYINGKIKKVECSYSLKGNTLRFNLGQYDRSKELIIDPELIFSTYSGSTADNFGYTATYDEAGHLYSGSTVFGTGYPTTTGAYQVTWAGGSGAGTAGTDIAITKFNLDGSDLIYSTYLGGSQDELPHSLITDDDGNLYVFGTTGSDDFPIGSDAFQDEFLGGASTTLGGIGVSYQNGSDMIVARLNTDGTDLIGSSYLGGTENDGTNTSTSLKYNYADEVRGEIEIDIDGNILIGSCTFSDDFPTSEDAVQLSKGEGQDAVLVKINPQITEIIASTFFGGSGDDAFYSINSFSDGTIITGGGSNSDDLPTTTDVIQEDFGGGQADGILAIFNSNFSNIDKMTYYGSSAYDQIYFVERDEFGNPHVYGQTEADGEEFIVNADYGVPSSGMLLSNFNPNLDALIWSTVFGSPNNTPNLSPTAFSVDICNRIYLSGWGGIVNSQGTTTGLDVTDDALKSSTDGNDFYFMVLEGDASEITFGSFYGGNTSAEHVDGGTSRFDRTGKIYQAVCAGCGSNDDFPIFPAEAHSPTNNSSNCNLGVAKIDFDLPLVFADFEADVVCLPDSTSFTNTSIYNSSSSPVFQWLFPNGDGSFDENPTYQFSGPGLYDITLIVTDKNACNLADTIIKQVEVFPSFILNVPEEVISCESDTLTVIAETLGTGTFFQWSSNSDFTDIILEGPIDSILTYAPGELSSIFILVSNGNCEEIKEILLAPRPTVELSLPDSVFCNMPEVEISVMLTNGYSASIINWTPDDAILEGQGNNIALIDLENPVAVTAQITTEFGCNVETGVNLSNYSIQLSVSPDTLTCSNTPIEIGASSFGTALSFLWSSSPDFSDIINVNGDSLITVNPTSLTYYYIQVENNGCILVDSVAVSLLSAGTSITQDQYICAGDTAQIAVSNDFPGSELTHFWEPDELILTGQGTTLISAIITEPTTFTVTSTSQEGCQVENSSTVFVSNLGNLDIVATAEPQNINPGSSSELLVMPAIEDYIYQWDPPDFLSTNIGTSTTSTPPSTITYLVTVTDIGDGGFCSRSDSVTIFVFEFVCGEPSIFVPNAFSPNGDGENDLLLVRGNNITDLKFSIFNRWGEKVFETEDQSIGWDGTFKQNLAEPAVFVYQLEVQCDDGQTYFTKGNVTLIR